MSDQVGVRVVGDEMNRKLASDVPRRRRMDRQILERRVDVRSRRPAQAIAPAKHHRRSRLRGPGPKDRASGRAVDRKTGQQLCELPHVVLPVIGVDTEGVELQNLPRQVLVETASMQHPNSRRGSD